MEEQLYLFGEESRVNNSMSIADIINKSLDIKESFGMPTKLLNVLLDEDKKEAFLNFIFAYVDLSKDSFRDYFQSEHSDRDKLKQDYTPNCLCELIARLAPKTNRILDICSGTGALTLGALKIQNIENIQCEEISSRALPVLICNLALRNLSVIVKQKDILTGKIISVYNLTKGEKFSRIEQADETLKNKFDVVISNPPYSLSWEPKHDNRFDGYEIPPLRFQSSLRRCTRL